VPSMRNFLWWVTVVPANAGSSASVVVRCRVSGTHEGVGRIPVNGGMLVGVTPTHKHFEVQHIHWYKLRDGMIIDHYANRDDMDMMRQLGLLPPIAASPPTQPR